MIRRSAGREGGTGGIKIDASNPADYTRWREWWLKNHSEEGIIARAEKMIASGRY